MKNLFKKYKYIIIPVACVILIGVTVGGVYLYSDNKKESEKFYPKKEEDSGMNNSDDDTSGDTQTTTPTDSTTTNNTTNTNTDITPIITLATPIEGTVISTSRSISGQAKNTNGQIFYEATGDQAGVVAEGSIPTISDGGTLKPFSGEIVFTKKPVSGDAGTLKLFVMTNGSKKLITEVGVRF